MSDADLTQLVGEFARAIFDPTAPVPTLWPTGVWGVLLVFVTQIGAGIPLGVLMARDAGLSPVVTAGLYLVSDLVLAVTAEPLLLLLAAFRRRNAVLGRAGAILERLANSAGLQEGHARGPLGVILISFSIMPIVGRMASEAAGYGFIAGWTLAIIGDMAYFGLVMASTLWISSVFGNDRLTIGAVLLASWGLPLLLRRFRRRSSVPAQRPRAMRAVATVRNGRRRGTRGLHR